MLTSTLLTAFPAGVARCMVFPSVWTSPDLAVVCENLGLLWNQSLLRLGSVGLLLPLWHMRQSVVWAVSQHLCSRPELPHDDSDPRTH